MKWLALRETIVKSFILPNFSDDVCQSFIKERRDPRITIQATDRPVITNLKILLNLLTVLHEVSEADGWQRIRTLTILSDEIRQWLSQADLPLMEQLSLAAGIKVEFLQVIQKIQWTINHINPEKILSTASAFHQFHHQPDAKVSSDEIKREDDASYLYRLFHQSMTHATALEDTSLWLKALGGLVHVTRAAQISERLRFSQQVSHVHELVRHYKRLHFYCANRDHDGIRRFICSFSSQVTQCIREWNTSLRNLYILLNQTEIELALKAEKLTKLLAPLAQLVEQVALTQGIDIEACDQYPYPVRVARNQHFIASCYRTWAEQQSQYLEQLERFHTISDWSLVSDTEIEKQFTTAIKALQLSPDDADELMDQLDFALSLESKPLASTALLTSFLAGFVSYQSLNLVFSIHPQQALIEVREAICGKIYHAQQRARQRAQSYRCLAQGYKQSLQKFPVCVEQTADKLSIPANPVQTNVQQFYCRNIIQDKLGYLERQIRRFIDEKFTPPYNWPQPVSSISALRRLLDDVLRLISLSHALLECISFEDESTSMGLFPYSRFVQIRIQDALRYRSLKKITDEAWVIIQDIKSSYDPAYLAKHLSGIDLEIISKNKLEDIILFLFGLKLNLSDSECSTPNEPEQTDTLLPSNAHQSPSFSHQVLNISVYYHHFIQGIDSTSNDNDVIRAAISTYELIIDDYEHSGLEAEMVSYMRHLVDLFRAFQSQGDSQNPIDDARFYKILMQLYSYDDEPVNETQSPLPLVSRSHKTPYCLTLLTNPDEIIQFITRIQQRWFKLESFSDAIDLVYRVNHALVSLVYGAQIIYPKMYYLLDRIEAENGLRHGVLSHWMDNNAHFISTLANRLNLAKSHPDKKFQTFPFTQKRQQHLAQYQALTHSTPAEPKQPPHPTVDLIASYQAHQEPAISQALDKTLEDHLLWCAKSRLRHDINRLEDTQHKVQAEIQRLLREHRFYNYNTEIIRLYQQLMAHLQGAKIQCITLLSNDLSHDQVRYLNNRIFDTTELTMCLWSHSPYRAPSQVKNMSYFMMILSLMLNYSQQLAAWLLSISPPETNLHYLNKRTLYLPFFMDEKPKAAAFVESYFKAPAAAAA